MSNDIESNGSPSLDAGRPAASDRVRAAVSYEEATARYAWRALRGAVKHAHAVASLMVALREATLLQAMGDDGPLDCATLSVVVEAAGNVLGTANACEDLRETGGFSPHLGGDDDANAALRGSLDDVADLFDCAARALLATGNGGNVEMVATTLRFALAPLKRVEAAMDDIYAEGEEFARWPAGVLQ